MSHDPWDDAGMVQVKRYRVGDLVTVRDCPGGSPLPEGLPQNATVRVVGFIRSNRLVEWEGVWFEVCMANVQSGLESIEIAANAVA